MSPIFSSVANPAPQQQPLHANTKMASVDSTLNSFTSLKRQRRPLKPARFTDLATDSSDEDEDENDRVGLSNNGNSRKKQCPNSRHVSISAVAPTTNHFVSPPSPPHSFGDFDRAIEFYSESDGDYHNRHDDDDDEDDNMAGHRNNSINIASLRRRRASMLNHNGAAFTCSSLSHRKRRSPTVPHQDLVARARCFEYLVSSIDEVWAQYCSITSYAEDEMYGEEDEAVQPRAVPYTRKTLREDLPASPTSLYQEEYDVDTDYSSTNESQGPRTPFSHSEPLTNTTSPKCAMNTVSNSVCLAPSEQPDSVRLLNLKKRLMNAKYFLQDLTECEDLPSSAMFWNRWDMIKYAAIELVEENGDDDDVVESVTGELEAGRYYRDSY